MCRIKAETYTENDKFIKLIHFSDKDLFYKFPIQEQDNITERLDSFIYALIFPMMEIGGDFYFDGNVSKSVLDNLEMFCKIWNIWFPEIYKPIKIHANEINDDYRPNNKKMVSAFSGGLDAAYTAYKYKNHLAGRADFDLEKSVMIHGADIPLSNKEQFDIAFQNAKKMTDDLGINLVPVETNYRDIFSSNWEHCFGAFMVSVLNFFSKSYSVGVASDASICTFEIPWGMNPITDQYLTNQTLKFVADGYEHSRTERAALIKEWELGVNNLRVCWCNEDKSKNCGFCEKCVRTKLNFLVNGVNNITSMPTQFSFKDLHSLPQMNGIHLQLYKEILDYARVNKSLPPKDIEQLEEFILKQEKCINKKNIKIIGFIKNIFSAKNPPNHQKGASRPTSLK